MPELPEVETVRRGLLEIVGSTIDDVVVTGPRTVRRHPPEELGALIGLPVEAIDRYGKLLVLRVGDDLDLVVHLRMSGQLRLHDPEEPAAPHTHARLRFGEREVRFVDPRTFGELFIASGRDGAGRPSELAGLGPDALAPGIDGGFLRAALDGRRSALKTVLLDQRVVAGIGNIYADEICFVAGVRPSRPGGTVGRTTTNRLAGAIAGVLGEAVAAGGSTLRDARYRGVRGEEGRFQERHAVYGRGGLPCLECGAEVRRVVLAGRSAHFCPRCQR